MKPIQEQLSIKTSVRFTEQEHGFLLHEADICGVTLSALIRKRSTGQHVAAKTDLRVLAELRRLGGLLKHIHNETRGAYGAQVSQAIREITAFVHSLSEELNARGG